MESSAPFQTFFIVVLHNTKEAQPNVVYHFPKNIENDKEGKEDLVNVPKFCFPGRP
jgi:hypothetical protein